MNRAFRLVSQQESPGLTFALVPLLLAGCAADSRDILVTPGPPSSVAEDGAITIREQSNVCVSVRVDPRIWPKPPLPTTDEAFSGVLATELSRLHEKRGGTISLPGPRRIPRFANNHRPSHPDCQDVGEDIYVNATYSVRADGKPLVFEYRIAQGSSVRSASFSRDLMGEFRRGELVYSNLDEPIGAAMADDIRARAVTIFGQID